MDESRDRRGQHPTGPCGPHVAAPRRAAVKTGALTPHLIRSGLTPPADTQFDTQVADLGALYRGAPTLAPPGEQVVSTAALTGVQALERKPPGLPLAPGTVERREFAYSRPGTCACLLSRNVVSGQIGASACGPTRTEADVLAHGQAVGASDPRVHRWHFVVDHLDIHRSASLVRSGATASTLERDLGAKGTRGILAHRQSRAAFGSDPRHRLGFHDTPKPTSWMHQIAIWLSLLVRKLRKRGSFTSAADLKSTILAFSEYDNQTMAKPFTWTYQGNVLVT